MVLFPSRSAQFVPDWVVCLISMMHGGWTTYAERGGGSVQTPIASIRTTSASYMVPMQSQMKVCFLILEIDFDVESMNLRTRAKSIFPSHRAFCVRTLC